MRDLAVGVWTDNKFLWLIEPLDQSEDFANQLPNVVLEQGSDPVDTLVDEITEVGLKFIAAAKIGEITEEELGFTMIGYALLVEPTEVDEIKTDNSRYFKVPIEVVMRGKVAIPDPYFELLQLMSQQIEEDPND